VTLLDEEVGEESSDCRKSYNASRGEQKQPGISG
jgi:hypothetical protein